MRSRHDPPAGNSARAAGAGPVTLALIAKAPTPGISKTRLCPPCSPAQAATLAEAALLDTLEAMALTPAARRVLVLDGVPSRRLVAAIDSYAAGGIRFEVMPQRGQGLAARLGCAFTDIGGPALIIGMDTPQLTPALLGEALALLAAPAVDAVLGEAEDGGYWTIGLRRPDEQVFQGVPMSASNTAKIQRGQLRTLGLRVLELERLRDVDRFADAIEVAAGAPATRFARALGEFSDVLAEPAL